MIRHMVHLRFASDVSAEQKDTLYERLAGLSSHLEGILSFEAARNASVETPLVRGFVDLFWIDFADVAARDAYLADPVHQAIGADIVACLDGGADGVFVCDIEL